MLLKYGEIMLKKNGFDDLYLLNAEQVILTPIHRMGILMQQYNFPPNDIATVSQKITMQYIKSMILLVEFII